MAGSYDQFFPDLAVHESVGVFDQNALPNYQAGGANGLNCLGAYQFDDWATIDTGCCKGDGSPQFAVGVDGWQQGASQAAATSYTYGKTEDLTLSSAFGAGGHDAPSAYSTTPGAEPRARTATRMSTGT